jgi:hypothetical protein
MVQYSVIYVQYRTIIISIFDILLYTDLLVVNEYLYCDNLYDRLAMLYVELLVSLEFTKQRPVVDSNYKYQSLEIPTQ